MSCVLNMGRNSAVSMAHAHAACVLPKVRFLNVLRVVCLVSCVAVGCVGVGVARARRVGVGAGAARGARTRVRGR